MFSEIEIQNFRGIRSFDIKGLNQVNIFFGKNNCCKSSILEGIFLLSGLSNPTLPIRLNNFRDFQTQKEDDLRLIFYKGCASERIKISGESQNFSRRSLELSVFKQSNNILNIEDEAKALNNAPSALFGYELSFAIDGKCFKRSRLTFDFEKEKNIRVEIDEEYNESLSSIYLHPKKDLSQSIEFIKDALKNKQEKAIIDALRKIEARIESLSVIDDIIYIDLGLDTLLPVNMMGDGIRKMLSIMACIYECKDSLIMIDEIDNGFHFSAMKSLWLAVIESARINNVQLFISTHNIDSIKGLNSILEDYEEAEFREKVSAFKLIRRDDDAIKNIKYNYEQLNFALEQELEVR